PLADTLAMRANFLLNRQDGYVPDAVTREKYGREENVTGRLQFRWEPSEHTTYNLTYEFDHTDQDEERPITSVANGSLRAPIGAQTVGDLPGHGAWIAGVAPILGLPFTADTPLDALYSVPLGIVYRGLGALGYTPSNPDADWDFFHDANSPGGASPLGPVVSDIHGGEEKRDLDAITLTIEHEFDWAKLTSVSAYKRFTSNNLQDDDGTNDVSFYLTTDNVEKNEQIYQELRFSGVSGGLTWTVGGSYFHEKAEQASVVAATTDTIDTLLYNLGATPGVLALSFDPSDGLNACESRFIDSLGGFIAFSKTALNCFNPAFVGTPLDGLSLEDVSNLAGTSFGGRLWTETMYGEGTFKAYSAFADATYAVSDRLNVTAGIRYTHDSKKWQWLNDTREIEGAAQLSLPGVGNLADIHQQILTGIFQQLVNPASQGDAIFDVAGLEGVPFTRDESWSNFSPRFAIDYKLGDDAMVYASYALGYKAGGYNTVQINSFFDNEKVWNIEAGMKSQWLDDSVRFNFSLWKYKYDDKQSIRLVSTDNGSVPFYQTRTQDVSGKGVDIELLWAPTSGLRFFANAGLQDITCSANCGDSAIGDPTGEPSVLFSFGGDYAIDLGNSGSLAFHADHSYRSAYRENGECRLDGNCGSVSYGGVTWETGEARNHTNARITWTNEAEDLSLSMFANNIFGNRYRGGIGGIGRETIGAPTTRPSEPGVWGIDLTKHF
ncbi:MAG: TonB-dependent receptor, partial [Kordiimonas sp.]